MKHWNESSEFQMNGWGKHLLKGDSVLVTLHFSRFITEIIQNQNTWAETRRLWSSPQDENILHKAFKWKPCEALPSSWHAAARQRADTGREPVVSPALLGQAERPVILVSLSVLGSCPGLFFISSRLQMSSRKQVIGDGGLVEEHDCPFSWSQLLAYLNNNLFYLLII